MGRMRREERDLRSLDRKSMLSIFKPLDADEPPVAGTPFRARNNLTGPFEPSLYEPFWKTLLTWLWLPALVIFLTLEVWIGIPGVIAWLLAIGFAIVYCVFGWLVYRKRG